MEKILIVLEGERTEADFFYHILPKFDIDAELCVVGTNLYTLYHKCKNYNFEADIRDVLKEIIKDTEIKKLMDQKFTYTYLVFDADLQHKAPEKRGEEVSINELITENLPKLIEMAEYFTDETDPSIGRLYINYPMMESFRYCNKFDDEQHISAKIPIDDMKNFKQLASKMKLAGIPIGKYERTDFENLMRMNVKRLIFVVNGKFDVFPDYNAYQNISEAQNIALKQHEMATSVQELYVLNTSILIILDYYGNRDNFYYNICC